MTNSQSSLICKTRVLVLFRQATKSCLDKCTQLPARINAVSFILCHSASVKPSEPAEFVSSCLLLMCGWQCRIMLSFSHLQVLFPTPLPSHTPQPLLWTIARSGTYAKILKGSAPAYHNYIMICNDKWTPKGKCTLKKKKKNTIKRPPQQDNQAYLNNSILFKML